jgi:hypothetical protein
MKATGECSEHRIMTTYFLIQMVWYCNMVCSASATLLRLAGKETENFHKGGQMYSLSWAIFSFVRQEKGYLKCVSYNKGDLLNYACQFLNPIYSLSQQESMALVNKCVEM